MRRLLVAICLALGIAVPAGAGAAPVIGAYLWGGLLGGKQAPEAFDTSLAFLLDRGFTAVRFAVGPKTLEGYGFDVRACGAEPSLPCMLEPFLRAKTLDDPRLRLVMVTLHDSFITRSTSYDPGTVARSADAILADHAAALAALDRRFAGKPVRIIISNWEGDNQVYCGGAYRFARNARFASECLATRGDLRRSVDAFIDWLGLRDEAIRRYKGAGGRLDVSQAPEVNNLLIFQDSCLTSCDMGSTLAARLEARGGVQTCAYSAYDGINVGKLAEALDRLARACGRMIIGELGFSLDRVKGERLRNLYASAAEALDARSGVVDAVFLWNAFEHADTKDTGYGLYRADGTPFALDKLPEAWRRSLRLRANRLRRHGMRRRTTNN